MERRILKEIDQCEDFMKVELVRLMAHINHHSSGASKKFWEEIEKRVTSGSIKVAPHHSIYVFYALSSVGMLTKKAREVST